jgi:hypothetical protein
MAARFMKYMNRPESNGAVRSERDPSEEYVNLIGRTRIQPQEGNVFEIRLTRITTGSR